MAEEEDKNRSFFAFKDDQESGHEGEEGQEEPDQQNPEEANNQVDPVDIEEQAKEQEKKKRKGVASTAYSVVFTIVFSLIWNTLILFPLQAVFGIFELCYNLLTVWCKLSEWKILLLNPILKVVFSSSIIYVCFQTIYGLLEGNYKEDVYILWYVDCFFLFLSHIMIYSIIQMTKNDDYSFSCSKIFTLNSENIDVQLINAGEFNCELIMDIPLQDSKWRSEYRKILGDSLEVDIDSQRFNTFINSQKHPTILRYIGYQLIKGQNKKYRPHMGQFIFLQVIALLKTFCCMMYIIYHFRTFTVNDLVNIICITLFTTNEIYCLSSMLGNYDLRRKTAMMNNLNDVLIVKGDKKSGDAIDLTNNESIETWDNTRRCIYEFFSSIQTSLERSYVCLFIYYLFITNIILAAYGEIYLVINKESILLQPLCVISSTFTFVLLNTLIFFRLYFGGKFNDTFEEISDSLDNLIGIYQDMLQMYDYNFTQRGVTKQDYLDMLKSEEEIEEERKRKELEKKQNGTQENKRIEVVHQETQSREEDREMMAEQISNYNEYYMCYDIFVSKFMYLSDYYIKNQEPFQGLVYKQAEEPELRQKMMQNALKSLKRIKSQINVDSKLSCYQAFNLTKLDFKESLTTISLGLLTLLPSIISKFIDQFTNAVGTQAAF